MGRKREVGANYWELLRNGIYLGRAGPDGLYRPDSPIVPAHWLLIGHFLRVRVQSPRSRRRGRRPGERRGGGAPRREKKLQNHSATVRLTRKRASHITGKQAFPRQSYKDSRNASSQLLRNGSGSFLRDSRGTRRRSTRLIESPADLWLLSDVSQFSQGNYLLRFCGFVSVVSINLWYIIEHIHRCII